MLLQVKLQEEHPWWFSPTYASPIESNPSSLWKSFKHLLSLITGSWLVAGDLNDIASYEKKEVLQP